MRETVIHSLFLFIFGAWHVWDKVARKKERETFRKPIYSLYSGKQNPGYTDSVIHLLLLLWFWFGRRHYEAFV